MSSNKKRRHVHILRFWTSLFSSWFKSVNLIYRKLSLQFCLFHMHYNVQWIQWRMQEQDQLEEKARRRRRLKWKVKLSDMEFDITSDCIIHVRLFNMLKERKIIVYLTCCNVTALRLNVREWMRWVLVLRV